MAFSLLGVIVDMNGQPKGHTWL